MVSQASTLSVSLHWLTAVFVLFFGVCIHNRTRKRKDVMLYPRSKKMVRKQKITKAMFSKRTGLFHLPRQEDLLQPPDIYILNQAQ